MKIDRVAVSLIGLTALGLAYYTGNVFFLALAVVAFIGGLYLMGANKKPAQKKKEDTKDKLSRQ